MLIAKFIEGNPNVEINMVILMDKVRELLIFYYIHMIHVLG